MKAHVFSVLMLAVSIPFASCVGCAGPGHPPASHQEAWADIRGTYEYGASPGMSYELTIDGHGEFVASWSSCLGHGQMAQGICRWEQGRLMLDAASPDGKRGLDWNNLILVRWGHRRYLVQEGRLLAFVNA